MNSIYVKGICLHRLYHCVKHHRYLRCFIYTCLLFFVIIILWLGYNIHAYNNDKCLIHELAISDRSVGYDAASWNAPMLDGISQNNVICHPKVWSVIYPVFSRVDMIIFRDINDSGVRHISPILEQFSQPITILVISDRITNEGLKSIGQLNNIIGFSLNSSNPSLSYKGIDYLQKASNLESLTIESDSLTDRSVYIISSFPKLKSVTLSNFPITPEALEALIQTKTLGYIDLRCAILSDKTISKIQEIQFSHPEITLLY